MRFHFLHALRRGEAWLFRKETVQNIWRVIVAFVMTALLLPVCAVAILCSPWAWDARGRGLVCWWIGKRVWALPLLYLIGVRVHVRGAIPDWGGSYVVAPNHTGILDHPAIVATVDRGRFVYKSDLNWYPFVGQIVMLAGQIAINRKKGKHARKRLQRTLKRWKGANIIIYPEGTRTKNGKLGVFKTGAAQMAINQGVPIIPVAISGAHQALAVVDPLLKFRPGDIVIEFGEPIAVEGRSAETLTLLLQQSITMLLESNSAR